jgi:Mn2+/Fe2+ NRAMP family transporter
MPHTRDEWSTLIAILGTTISPYLFFWQVSHSILGIPPKIGQIRFVPARLGPPRGKTAEHPESVPKERFIRQQGGGGVTAAAAWLKSPGPNR